MERNGLVREVSEVCGMLVAVHQVAQVYGWDAESVFFLLTLCCFVIRNDP